MGNRAVDEEEIIHPLKKVDPGWLAEEDLRHVEDNHKKESLRVPDLLGEDRQAQAADEAGGRGNTPLITIRSFFYFTADGRVDFGIGQGPGVGIPHPSSCGRSACGMRPR